MFTYVHYWALFGYLAADMSQQARSIEIVLPNSAMSPDCKRPVDGSPQSAKGIIQHAHLSLNLEPGRMALG